MRTPYRELVEASPDVRVAFSEIGIAPLDLVAIFDTFHQAAVTTKGGREGAGFGLTITRRIVEKHRGHIGVESDTKIANRAPAEDCR